MRDSTSIDVKKVVEDSVAARTSTAERVVLSCILQRPIPSYEEACRLLKADDFCDEFHRALFEQVGYSMAAGDPLEAAMIGERVACRVSPGVYPGIQYLRRLVGMPEGKGDVAPYAKVVVEHATRRELEKRLAEHLKRLRSADNGDVKALLAGIQADIDGLSGRGESIQDKTYGPIGEFAERALDQVQEVLERQLPDGVIGIRTGFDKLDEELLGLQEGDLIVLAARPSMGKTTLAQNIADNVSANKDLCVVMFSLEMSGESLAMRGLSAQSGIDNRRLRTGQIQSHEWDKLLNAAEKAKQFEQWIDTHSSATPSHMKRRCREIEKRTGKKIGLVVVDYMQLMESGADGSKEARAQQVAAISRGLKALAKELRVPVLALSQLNRGLEQRPDKRPIMADLRESGAIEQDADVILFVYRDEVYNPDTPDPGMAEIIIAKQRNGPIGVVRLRFSKEESKFSNVL